MLTKPIQSVPASANADARVVADFGAEWSRFDQSALSPEERQSAFDEYFGIFDWDRLPTGAVGADIGCGSGRWALLVAPRICRLHCVDASAAALSVARQNLASEPNVEFHHASVDALPFEPNSLDFAYSLGVLHHVPDTAAAVRSVVNVLKRGSPFLVYLYYAFDNRPLWFKLLWRVSDLLRRAVCELPLRAKQLVADIIAAFVYWPLGRSAALLETLRILPAAWPLSVYRNRSFYSMRTDALDRFGTRLEQRFTKAQIERMMLDAGLAEIRFSDGPYWCAVGYKR